MYLHTKLNELLTLSTMEKKPETEIKIAEIIQDVYIKNKLINHKFSLKTFSSHLLEKIKEVLTDEFNASEKNFNEKIKKNSIFTQENTKEIFIDLESAQPKKIKVMTPISGIRLEKNASIQIGPFKISKSSEIKHQIDLKELFYISIVIHETYDNDIAISKAEEAFQDFNRLIVFIAGNYDKSVKIKIGLPVLNDIGNNFVYHDTSSYILENENNEIEEMSINNNHTLTIPIDNDFFVNNKNYNSLWDIYSQKNLKMDSKKHLNMKERILNASIAIGESMKSHDIKNSIIHSCIAFETLFSFNEESLFQKSISDKLADTLVFIVSKDKESRIKTSSDIKKFYSLRSALVHGASKNLNNEYMSVNILLSAAINALLNNKRFQDIERIDELYNMVKEAQYSYKNIEE